MNFLSSSSSSSSPSSEDAKRKRKIATDEEGASKKLCVEQKTEAREDKKLSSEKKEFRKQFPYLTRDSYYIGLHDILLALPSFVNSVTLIVIEYTFGGVFAAYAQGDAHVVLLDEGCKTSPVLRNFSPFSHVFKRREEQPVCYSLATSEGVFFALSRDVHVREVLPDPELELSSFDKSVDAIARSSIIVTRDYTLRADAWHLDRYAWGIGTDSEVYRDLILARATYVVGYTNLLDDVISRSGSAGSTQLLRCQRLLRETFMFLTSLLRRVEIDEETEEDKILLLRDSRALSDELFARFDSAIQRSEDKSTCHPRPSKVDECECRCDIAHVKSLAFACIREIDRSFCLLEMVDETHNEDEVTITRRCFNRDAAFTFILHHDSSLACVCRFTENPEEVCPYK
jgi:hypothetical protein